MRKALRTRGWPASLLTAAAAVALGGALILLSVPIVVADFLEMPGNPVLRQPQVAGEVDPERIARLIASRQRALAWRETGQLWADLGLAYLLAAEATPDEARRQHLELGERALERGLALAPANTFAWTRLAYARLQLRGRLPQVAEAVRMAIVTGPHEHALAFLRLRIALNVWDLFTPEDRDLIARQIRFTWKLAPERLVEIAHATRRTAITRDALRNMSGAVERFDRLEQPLLRKPS